MACIDREEDKINRELKNKVNEYAVNHGYKGAKYIGNWKKYKIYEPYIDTDEISYTGLPLVILVNTNDEIRMSTSEEAMFTLDEMNNEEDIYLTDIKNNTVNNNPKLSSDESVNKMIHQIDDKIEQLKNNQVNETINLVSDTEIDKIMNDNLEEMMKSSILDKSINELLSTKKKFIDDWYTLLINTVDEYWVMNSGIYRVHIHSIIDAILRRIEDETSKKQLEVLN